ncbi:hypothetical protein MMC13_006470 [Lambiella insularis]|nr:hypothetical protein [Lambiella insularis]
MQDLLAAIDMQCPNNTPSTQKANRNQLLLRENSHSQLEAEKVSPVQTSTPGSVDPSATGNPENMSTDLDLWQPFGQIDEEDLWAPFGMPEPFDILASFGTSDSIAPSTTTYGSTSPGTHPMPSYPSAPTHA